MKVVFFLFSVLTLLTLQSCQKDNRKTTENDNLEVPAKQETPEKMIETLVGEWEKTGDTGVAGNRDQQGGAAQTLTFTEEARYVMREGNEKTDSGAYRMNEQLQNLYLESEANEKPREYEVKLNRDTLILTAKDGSQPSGNDESVYVKRN